MTPAKIDVTLKMNARPTKVGDAANGWETFAVDCGGRVVTFTLRPKAVAKFDDAEKRGTPWVAAVVGKMGEAKGTSFVLEDPVVQIFEVKPKVAEASAT